MRPAHQRGSCPLRGLLYVIPSFHRASSTTGRDLQSASTQKGRFSGRYVIWINTLRSSLNVKIKTGYKTILGHAVSFYLLKKPCYPILNLCQPVLCTVVNQYYAL